MDNLGIEPRASRMLSGCDTTTPTALLTMLLLALLAVQGLLSPFLQRDSVTEWLR